MDTKSPCREQSVLAGTTHAALHHTAPFAAAPTHSLPSSAPASSTAGTGRRRARTLQRLRARRGGGGLQRGAPGAAQGRSALPHPVAVAGGSPRPPTPAIANGAPNLQATPPRSCPVLRALVLQHCGSRGGALPFANCCRRLVVSRTDALGPCAPARGRSIAHIGPGRRRRGSGSGCR